MSATQAHEHDARQMYEARGLAGRVGYGARPALLVIDFIRGFTDPECPLASDLDTEIAATVQLLSLCRERKIPIVHTTTSYGSSFMDAGVWIKKIPSNKWLAEGSPWVELDERLERCDDEHLIAKKYASAFFGTDLISTLTARQVDTLIVTGVSTSGCVRASVVDACSYGLRTIVVEEAVGDRAQGPHHANLFDMDSKYADVVQLADAIEYLRNLPRATT